MGNPSDDSTPKKQGTITKSNAIAICESCSGCIYCNLEPTDTNTFNAEAAELHIHYVYTVKQLQRHVVFGHSIVTFGEWQN